MNLNVNYNFVLAKLEINLVVLANELELPSFFGFDVFESFLGGT
jgi:hypothetical protein